MKKLDLFLITTILLFGLSVMINAQDDSSVKTKTFNVKKGGTLNVTLNTGDVRISTWDKNEVLIKIKSDDKEEISGISTTYEGNTVKISNKDESGWAWGGSGDVSVSVSIPSEFNLEINTLSGDVKQTGSLRGSVTVFTAGGDISITDITGKAALKSNGGDITTGDIGSDLVLSTNGGDVQTGAIGGKTNISTMGGSINVKKAGKDLEVNTMGGDISIGDIGGKADVKTMGGSITINKVAGNANIITYGGNISLSGANGNVEASTFGGDIRMTNISGSVKLDTKSGDIYLELNPTGNKGSKIKTMNGRIRVSLPSNAKATIAATIKFRGTWARNTDDEKYGITSDFKSSTFDVKEDPGIIRAVYQLNGGGEKIEIDSYNGSIEIRKK